MDLNAVHYEWVLVNSNNVSIFHKYIQSKTSISNNAPYCNCIFTNEESWKAKISTLALYSMYCEYFWYLELWFFRLFYSFINYNILCSENSSKNVLIANLKPIISVGTWLRLRKWDRFLRWIIISCRFRVKEMVLLYSLLYYGMDVTSIFIAYLDVWGCMAISIDNCDCSYCFFLWDSFVPTVILKIDSNFSAIDDCNFSHNWNIFFLWVILIYFWLLIPELYFLQSFWNGTISDLLVMFFLFNSQKEIHMVWQKSEWCKSILGSKKGDSWVTRKPVT